MSDAGRDPRVDPRPGDVLQQPGTVRQQVVDRDGKWLLIADGLLGQRAIHLNQWTRWALKYARVVARGAERSEP